MEEKMTSNSQVSPEEGRQVNNGVEHVSEKTLIGITGDLSSEDKEFCEKETKQIMDLLSPKQFARFVSKKLYLIDLYGAEEVGEIIVARLAMNRKPKTYDYTLHQLGIGRPCVLPSWASKTEHWDIGKLPRYVEGHYGENPVEGYSCQAVP